MYTLSEIAQNFGLKLSTLRYWLKRNTEDCENGLYEFNLMDLTQRIQIQKRTATPKNFIRGYEHIIILDLNEFKEEFFKYTEFVETNKRKKANGNLYWTYSAIECYSCDMDCKKCFNKEICNKIVPQDGDPPMKNVVKKLLNSVGKPKIKQFYN